MGQLQNDDHPHRPILAPPIYEAVPLPGLGQATVTLSGDPGATGFKFDLLADMELNGEVLPTSP